MELVRSSGVILFFKIGTIGFNYLFFLGLSKLFGAAEVGYFAFSFTVIQMFSFVARSGMEIGIFKEIANGELAAENLIRIRNKAGIFMLVVSAVIILVLYLFRGILSSYILESREMAGYLLSFMISMPFYAFMFFNAEIHRARKRFNLYAIYQNFGMFFILCIFLLIKIWFWDWEFERLSLLFLLCLAFIAALSFAGTGKILSSSKGDKSISFKTFLNLSIPIGLSSLCFFLMRWLDGVVLAQYYEEEVVGIYAIAFRIGIIGSFVLLSVNSAIGPSVSKLFSENKKDEMIREVRKTTKMGFWLTFPIVVLTLVFPEFLLGIFGKEYQIAVLPLILILCGQFINTIVGPTGIVLQLCGYQNVFRNIIVITTIVAIALNYILIPKFGMNGAALANGIAVLIWNIWSTFIVYEKFGQTFFYIPLLKK